MVVGALPLALVTCVALGVVIWLHTRDVLARTGTGAVEYLPTFLSAAVLLELGYLTNADQEKLLATDGFQNAVVSALVEAVVRFNF